MLSKSNLRKIILIILPGFLITFSSVNVTHITEIDPCEFLNNELIEEFFDVNVNEINRKSSSSSNPSCTVDWAKPNLEELQKGHQEAMSNYMQDKMAGKDVKMPAYPGNNKVTLTIHGTEFTNKSSAENSFNAAMQKLQQGTTMELNGKMETMFQYNTVPVEDVADAAHWVDGLSQLSVLSGLRIFHLSVKVSENAEENLNSAKDISRTLAKSIN